MAYQLRERDYLTLEDMKKGVVSVEANLIEKRARETSERRVTYKDDNTPTSSSVSYTHLTLPTIYSV